MQTLNIKSAIAHHRAMLQVSTRKSFTYEDFYTSEKAAYKAARDRKVNTHKQVYVSQTSTGYVVYTHGIQRAGWKLLKTL